MKHQQVATHHVASRNALLLPVADDQRTRCGKVAQRFERALGLALLRQRDAYHHDDRTQQEGSLRTVAKRKVGATGCQQHQEHRLRDHFQHDGGCGFGRTARQQVGAVEGQPLLRLGSSQAA